jgi:hypothetical protein
LFKKKLLRLSNVGRVQQKILAHHNGILIQVAC